MRDLLKVRIIRDQSGELMTSHHRQDDGVIGQYAMLSLNLLAFRDVPRGDFRDLRSYLDDGLNRSMALAQGFDLLRIRFEKSERRLRNQLEFRNRLEEHQAMERFEHDRRGGEACDLAAGNSLKKSGTRWGERGRT